MKEKFGDYSIVDTPVPISNTEVKHYNADDSEVLPCESRSLPSFLSIHNGGLAQLGEHLPYKQEVGGSSPSTPTIYVNAGLAQLVEQLTCNQ